MKEDKPKQGYVCSECGKVTTEDAIVYRVIKEVKRVGANNRTRLNIGTLCTNCCGKRLGIK